MIHQLVGDLKRNAFAVVNWLAPSPCIVCGFHLVDPYGVCGYCVEIFELQRRYFRTPAYRPLGIRRILALGPYRPPLDRVVLRLKHQQPHLARGFAQALHTLHHDELRQWGEQAPILIPVALHPERLAARGYNQSIELAKEIGRCTGFELQRAGLLRRGKLRIQQARSANDRQLDLKESFETNPSLAPYLKNQSQSGRPVVLVDDVMTTGATLSAAALALRRAGVVTIDALVMCWSIFPD